MRRFLCCCGSGSSSDPPPVVPQDEKPASAHPESVSVDDTRERADSAAIVEMYRLKYQEQQQLQQQEQQQLQMEYLHRKAMPLSVELEKENAYNFRSLAPTGFSPKKPLLYSHIQRQRNSNNSPKKKTNRKIVTCIKKLITEHNHKYINQYRILQSIGSGSYGTVKLALDTIANRHVALKVLSKALLRKKRSGMVSKLQQAYKEIDIQSRLDHVNVVQLYEVIDDPRCEKLYLVLEYCSGGPVMPTDGWFRPLSENQLRTIMQDLFRGLTYLHSMGVFHRDIKPENLLFDADGRVKISDFGVSHAGDEILYETAGSPAFMSPEMCRGDEYSARQADVWACGITLFMLVYGEVPFGGADHVAQMYHRIQFQPLEFPHQNISAELSDLLKRILDKNPATRITLPEAVQHPWFSHGVPDADALELSEIGWGEEDAATTWVSSTVSGSTLNEPSLLWTANTGSSTPTAQLRASAAIPVNSTASSPHIAPRSPTRRNTNIPSILVAVRMITIANRWVKRSRLSRFRHLASPSSSSSSLLPSSTHSDNVNPVALRWSSTRRREANRRYANSVGSAASSSSMVTQDQDSSPMLEFDNRSRSSSSFTTHTDSAFTPLVDLPATDSSVVTVPDLVTDRTEPPSTPLLAKPVDKAPPTVVVTFSPVTELDEEDIIHSFRC